MANSAGNDIPNSLEAGGEISPEDAERFAAAFRPSWELDDAPFTQGTALAKEDLLSLSADANTIVDATRPDEPFGPTPSSSQPAANPLVNTQPLVAKPQKPPPPKAAQAVPAPTGYDGVAPLYIKPARKGGQSSATSTRDDLEVPIKKSNKGIIFAVIGVVVLAGVGFALKVALSGDDSKPTTPTQTQTTSPTEDTSRAVPPPPPATEATAATPAPKPTAPAPATTTPPKDTATSAVAAANTHFTPPTPPAPSPKPVAAAPQPKPQPQPQPPSQPKTPPKPAGGGIVRDNPF